MPDHGKIGLRELKSCIHDLNEAILRLNQAAAHFEHARKLRLDVEELQRIEALLREDALASLVKCIERTIGKEEKN